ncbi:MAG TPA: DUF2171 domain-containing protein [Sphingomicrobium sp.]|nr:DUF2171 domain-containing protein [Sphingomicrobium sp.]
MAYDRYDTRRESGRHFDHDRGRRDERGFFERAGDEVASWFGDEEAERRRREDERRDRMDRERGFGRDWDRDRYTYRGQGRDFDRERDWDRNRGSSRAMGWSSGDRDHRSSRSRSGQDYERMGYAGYDHDFSSRGGFAGTSTPDYMSPTGPSFGYGGTFGAGTSSGYGSGGWGSEFEGRDRDRYARSERDDSRFTGNRDNDRHYHSWRQRQLDELDRDYDQYCRERQERFESDFGSWRQNRLSKRRNLGSIREHMDVVGSDGETVGKVDCVKGDHIVLTKSDSDDNRHHAIDCSMVQTVEGDQVRLEMPAEEAKSRWEDADKRGFFGRNEREDTSLERSFSGTYES